ncbi:MAG: B12-binding domain-containing radical SAM protein [Spirochaetota bacterium]
MIHQDISILLINPWVTDFAAYNYWAEPLGLLYTASILKQSGAHIFYINCLHSKKAGPSPRPDGRSRYRRTVIPKPPQISFVPRNYALYGMTRQELLQELKTRGRPDIVLVGSTMTYWYPGVFRTVQTIKQFYGPDIPVVLGGIYARLCPEHAKQYSGADFVFTDDRARNLLKLIEEATSKRFPSPPAPESFSDYPAPLHQLEGKKGFISVLTRKGCPFSCTYCASGLLNKHIAARSRWSVTDEIETYSAMLGAKNVAFYDDSLLWNAPQHIIPIFEEILRRGLRLDFHLPNGIHSKYIYPEVAEAMYKTGVKTIRIGLETLDRQLLEKTGGKITNADFLWSVKNLVEAGYKREEIGTYIMAGLLGQAPRDVEKTIDFVYRAGASPFLALFSPIPGTRIWKEVVRSTPFPVRHEPLFHNNTVFILGSPSYPPSVVQQLKDRAAELRKSRPFLQR